MIDFNKIINTLFILILFVLLLSQSESDSLGSELGKFLNKNKIFKRILRNISLILLITYFYVALKDSNAKYKVNYISNVIRDIYMYMLNIDKIKKKKIKEKLNIIENNKKTNDFYSIIIIYILYLLFTRSKIVYIFISFILITLIYIISCINDINYFINRKIYNIINKINRIIHIIIFSLLFIGSYQYILIKKKEHGSKFSYLKFFLKTANKIK